MIFINMIRLLSILTEQTTTPDKKISRNNILDKPVLTSETNAKKIAQQIYDSKGTFSDDEKGALNAIKQILSIEQYKLVSAELQKLTNKRGLGEYLHEFMDFRDLYKVAEHLVKVLPKKDWSWTVKKVFTWEDLIEEVSYRRPGAAGMVPSSSQRPSELQTLQMLFNNWAANKNSIKKDLLYKMLMDPALYATQVPNLLSAFKSRETHAGLENTASLLYFAGPIGIGLASLAMTADAKLHWDEGNKLGAGISAFFAALPLINRVVQKIPAVQKIKRAALAKLGEKISKFKSFAKTGSFKSITEKELASLPKDEADLIRQFQQHEKFLYESVKTPAETWKAILKDPKLQTYKKSLTPEEWQSVQSGIFNGKYTYQDIKQMAEKKFAAQGLGITAGIKFTPAELQSIDRITDDVFELTSKGSPEDWYEVYFKTYNIENVTIRAPYAARYEFPSPTNIGQKHTKILPGQPRFLTGQNVKVHMVTISRAEALGGGSYLGWVDGANEIYIVPEKFMTRSGKFNKQKFKSTLTHELAHLKDPATKQSKKLRSTYDPDAGQDWTFNPDVKNPKKNWFKNYYFHNFEQSAMRAESLEQIVYSTNKLAKTAGKKKTLKVLDDAITFFATENPKYFTDDVQKLLFSDKMSMFGQNQDAVTLFNTLSANSPKQYKTLVSQIVKQLRSNKSEVLKMKNIADGVIKLKDLL